MVLQEMGLAEARARINKKEISHLEVVDACLEAASRSDGVINAFLEIYADEARHAARRADGRLATGEKLDPIEGLPVALKDNLLDFSHAVTAGSRILEGYVSPYSATAVARLRERGAAVVGRTNMDEFAMGSSTESSAWKKTVNPWDAKRVPGGSSGGSAAAVAADFCLAALGSDTGGSIRQPAALTGVVGLKPTYGRVSRYGLIAMASSLDQIGPIVKSVEDAAILLAAIAGADPNDSTTVDKPVAQFQKRDDLRGVKIGVPREYIEGIADLPMGAAIERALEELEKFGAELCEVRLPHAAFGLAVYYVLMPAEVSSNLARFDGMRFGPRQAGENLLETYRQTRGRLFGDEAKRRIMLGAFALSAGYYDAFYRRAQEARTLISEDYSRAFQQVDVLATPTSPATAWPLGEKINDPLAMYLADVDTVSANVAGLPAISIPAGLSEGLPIGLQFIGPKWEEGKMLSIAEAAERRFQFREKHRPPAVSKN
jgi:aspartyl-tRNA(Asn)/glutamyl-tRNA(Gln) amidotransferase subunit A